MALSLMRNTRSVPASWRDSTTKSKSLNALATAIGMTNISSPLFVTSLYPLFVPNPSTKREEPRFSTFSISLTLPDSEVVVRFPQVCARRRHVWLTSRFPSQVRPSLALFRSRQRGPILGLWRKQRNPLVFFLVCHGYKVGKLPGD